jgi:pyruvate formate lyase activating enzyme
VAAAPSGTVFNVQRASFHDGPGVRTTVFLKGCPLSCPWCHNPEGIAARPEVLYGADRCLSCGACADACPRVGGPLPAGAELGSDGCAACGACAQGCPTQARQIAGHSWTVGEVLGEVLRDRLAYDTSGGGVTFSGGEPLAQGAFLLACLDACRRAGLRTAVDTCGAASRDVAVAVAKRTHLLLWDVKHTDEARHRTLTGAPLAPILANLGAVAEIGVPIWLRVPVVPGMNDDDDNLAAVARLAAATPNVQRVSLLPYHHTGSGKLGRLGRTGTAVPAANPAPARMRALATALAATGVAATIGG